VDSVPRASPVASAVLAALAALAAAPRALAQEPAAREWQLELAVPVTALSGHTTYRIEGASPAGSVVSELGFSLAGLAAGLEAQLGTKVGERSRLVFRLQAVASVGGSTGTLEDSDWLEGAPEIAEVGGAAHPGLDIYSRSVAELEAVIVDARVAWEGWRAAGFLVAPMAGLLYQRFAYDVRDAEQVGYGPYAPLYTGTIPGRVIDYRVSYHVPYAGARATTAGRRLTGSAELWVSPLALANDRDDHLKRWRLSTTVASGTAWQGSVAARLALGRRDFLEAHASLTQIGASGTQRQRFYAGPYAGRRLSIGSEITSSRTSLSLVYARRM
jgi:outer membrane protease